MPSTRVVPAHNRPEAVGAARPGDPVQVDLVERSDPLARRGNLPSPAFPPNVRAILEAGPGWWRILRKARLL